MTSHARESVAIVKQPGKEPSWGRRMASGVFMVVGKFAGSSPTLLLTTTLPR
jgi:hypothetical protein